MEVNMQWLKLKAPEETHIFWLGNGYPWPDDGFNAQCEAAKAMLDFPLMWIDMDGYWCGIYGDPLPSFFDGAVMHEEGWYVPEG